MTAREKARLAHVQKWAGSQGSTSRANLFVMQVVQQGRAVLSPREFQYAVDLLALAVSELEAEAAAAKEN